MSSPFAESLSDDDCAWHHSWRRRQFRPLRDILAVDATHSCRDGDRAARGVATATACPTAAAKRAIEGFRKPAELHHFEVAEVRQCLRTRIAGKRAYWVVGTFGQPKGSKSEVGWAVYRFLLSARGKLLTKPAVSSAGWTTGVSIGKVRFVDLDGDSTNEILEVRDQFLASPDVTTTSLTVWRKRRSRLVALVAIPTKHTVGEMSAMHGFSVEPSASPNCIARYRVVKRGRRAHDIAVTYTKSARVGGKPLPRPKSLRRHVAQMTKRIAHPHHGSAIGCLPRRSFRLRFAGGTFQVH